MRLIDTHCHLYDPDAFPDPAWSIREAAAGGVDCIVVVGIDEETSIRALELAEKFGGVFATIGWHPNHAAKYRSEHLKEIERLARHPKAVAIGEIGLDFHWDFATRAQQEKCLRDQFELAKAMEMPTVFHCRKAYPELLSFVANDPLPHMIFHCFSGTNDDAAQILEWDSYFGVDGPITYPKAEALRKLVAALPRDRVLIETDAPYMTPHPHRSDRNKPLWVSLVNRGLAEIWNSTEEDCAVQTTLNAERAFRLTPFLPNIAQ